MVSKNGDKPNAKSVTSLIQNKRRDQHMLTACCIPIWIKQQNIDVNPTGYITSLKTKINAKNPKMNEINTRASELHKGHNFYDHVTFKLI